VDAGVVNSTLTEHQAERELDEVHSGRAKLLYVTPERFADADFMAAARGPGRGRVAAGGGRGPLQLRVGHSFRPAYLALGRAAADLGHPTVLALTATATPWVRRGVVQRLGLRDPLVLARGSDRPNLFLEVLRVEAEAEDRRALRRLLTEPADEERYGAAMAASLTAAMAGSGIVYCATTRGARETAGWLRGWGVAADYYHGRRPARERERVQDAFMAGEVRVICATNAFGLGVDKPDVRFVVHRDVLASVAEHQYLRRRAAAQPRPDRSSGADGAPPAPGDAPAASSPPTPTTRPSTPGATAPSSSSRRPTAGTCRTAPGASGTSGRRRTLPGWASGASPPAR
jgi:ATP-dependent DNA helicase RecQ